MKLNEQTSLGNGNEFSQIRQRPMQLISCDDTHRTVQLG